MGAFFAACGDGRFETGISSTIKRILPKSLVALRDRKSTRLNSSHGYISYAVFCLKKKKNYHVSSRLCTFLAGLRSLPVYDLKSASHLRVDNHNQESVISKRPHTYNHNINSTSIRL